MISKCANPTCSRPFHYLRGGRLYCFELRPGNSTSARPASRVTVYFWICEQCCTALTLEFDTERGVLLKETWEKSPPRQLRCDVCIKTH